jgi:hypothetical protein
VIGKLGRIGEIVPEYLTGSPGEFGKFKVVESDMHVFPDTVL